MANEDLKFGQVDSVLDTPLYRVLPGLERAVPQLAEQHGHGTQESFRAIGDHVSSQLSFAINYLVEEHDRTVRQMNSTIKLLRDELSLVQFIDPSFGASNSPEGISLEPFGSSKINAGDRRANRLDTIDFEAVSKKSPAHGTHTHDVGRNRNSATQAKESSHSRAPSHHTRDSSHSRASGHYTGESNHSRASGRSENERQFHRPKTSISSNRSGPSKNKRGIESDLDVHTTHNPPLPIRNVSSKKQACIGNEVESVYDLSEVEPHKGQTSLRQSSSDYGHGSGASTPVTQPSDGSPKSNKRSGSPPSPRRSHTEQPMNSMHWAPPSLESEGELPGCLQEREGNSQVIVTSLEQEADVEHRHSLPFNPVFSLSDSREQSLVPTDTDMVVTASMNLNMTSTEPDQQEHKPELKSLSQSQTFRVLRSQELLMSQDLEYCKRRCWEIDENRFAILTWKHSSHQRKSITNMPRTLAEQLLSLEQQAITAASERCVVHPQSRKRLVWDVLAMLFLAYDFIVVPLHFFELPESMGLYLMDLVILIYWSLDMVASFFTGVFFNGQLIMTIKDIASVYVRRWFAFDCLIVMPEWLVMLSQNGKSGAESHVGLARVLRSTRFIRILRFLRLLRLVKVDKVFRDLKGRVNNNAYLLFISLIRLTVGVIFLIHCLACAWYGLGKLSPQGWIFNEGIVNKPLGDRYLYSFQFAMARLHPSSYDKNLLLATIPERIFAVITSLLAFAGCGAFVSSVTNTMAQLQAFRQQRVRKLFVIREYVRDYNISVQLSTRVQKYIEKSITRKLREQHAHELSTMLPMTLLLDLRFEAWTPFLAPEDFFGEFTDSHPRTVWCLCREALIEVSVLGGETIFYTGDTCAKVLFPSSGKLTYVLGQTTGVKVEELQHLQRDVPVATPISEAVIWTPWENKGELCAFVDSSLLTLSAKEFIRTVRDNERAMLQAIERCDFMVQWLCANSNCVSDILPKKANADRNSSKAQSNKTSLRSSKNSKSGSRLDLSAVMVAQDF